MANHSTEPGVSGGGTAALETPMTRRSAVGKLAYAAPAVAVLVAAAPERALGRSGPKEFRGNNGFGQEKQGAPKDGPPAGKDKNDKDGPR